MRSLLLAISLGAILTQAKCPPREEDGEAASAALIKWAEDAVDDFFPNHDGWDKGFDRAFSPGLYATLNSTEYDFAGFKAAYAEFEPLLVSSFNGTHTHGFYKTVGVPNANDTGGFVIMAGWEGGLKGGNPNARVNATNGAYAWVVEDGDCARRIVEWRDATNLG